MYRQASVLNRSGKNYLCTCLAEFLQSVDKVIKLLRYRLHFRSTGLPLVSTVNTICRGAKIADLIAIGGTLDYVVPDIDR